MQDAVELISRFDVAVPFLATAVLMVVSAGASLAVEDRLEKVIEGIFDEALASKALPAPPPFVPLTPKSLASLTPWVVDAVQLLSNMIGPALGLVFISDSARRDGIFLYWLAIGLAIAAFFVFVYRVNPRIYGRVPLGVKVGGRQFGLTSRGIATPVTQVSIIVNLAAAGAAGSAAPIGDT